VEANLTQEAFARETEVESWIFGAQAVADGMSKQALSTACFERDFPAITRKVRSLSACEIKDVPLLKSSFDRLWTCFAHFGDRSLGI